MNKIKELLAGGSQDKEDQPDPPNVRTPHERAQEDLDVWKEGARTFYLCEACNQVFVSFDVLYDHLWASEVWPPDDDSRFDYYRELKPEDTFPDGSIVGPLEPCEGTEVTKE